MDLNSLIIIAALLLVNIVAFAAYGIDKRKAQKNKWRIPESTLLLLVFIGGSLGALLGMVRYSLASIQCFHFLG